jgi:hypothetical protein
MLPTAPPVIINMPPSGAPWWAPYLLAGFFVVIGAAIGLLSTKLSDKRKLKADDRRQWDKEIRDLYLEAMESYREIYKSRWERQVVKLQNSFHMRARQETEALESVCESLELIANEATVTALRTMTQAADAIASQLHDGVNAKEPYLAMNRAQSTFMAAVKDNLRTAEKPKLRAGDRLPSRMAK